MTLASEGRPWARHPVLGLIGNTPMVPLRRVWRPDHPVSIQLKLEGFNPGGSVKDRAALYMVERSLRRGELEGRWLLDATSGNTGIAYAMIGAALGLRVAVCLPANASEERRMLLEAYGARVILTDPLEGSEGARVEARRLAEAYPQEFFWVDQYNNPANPQAHYETTGPEIWRATGGRITHLVAGAGTGGTLMGTGRYLKEQDPGVQVVGVQPDHPLHGLEGLKHMATADVPGIYRAEALDSVEYVATEEAYAMVRRLAAEEGVLAGPSGGAAVVVALRLAARLERGLIVAVLPDSGARYLSTPVWKEPGSRRPSGSAAPRPSG